MRAAVVDLNTNHVVSVIVADATIDKPSDGAFLVNLPENSWVKIGSKYDTATQTFIDRNPPFVLPSNIEVYPFTDDELNYLGTPEEAQHIVNPEKYAVYKQEYNKAYSDYLNQLKYLETL